MGLPWRIVGWKYEPGNKNTICDVEGVRVGHCGVRYDEPRVARTGVTVVMPPARFPDERLPAAAFVFNGTGELTGLHQVNEWGCIETPIALTGTSGVPAAAQGLLRLLLESAPELGVRYAPPLPVVGECNDMYLHDVRSLALRPEHVFAAVEAASDRQGEWGPCGAGSGMVAFGFKGGVGSASRCVRVGATEGTVGVLCLVNFGPPGELRIGGPPVGHLPGEIRRLSRPKGDPPDGSMVAVVATDLPLDHLGLLRMAKRGPLAMARLGSYGRHGSGDIFLSFSTANRQPARPSDPIATVTCVRQSEMNDIFAATVEALEEGMLSALWSAEGVFEGREGHRVLALPKEHVLPELVRLGIVRQP